MAYPEVQWRPYVSNGDLKHLLILPPLPNCWHYRSSFFICQVLQIYIRYCSMLGQHSMTKVILKLFYKFRRKGLLPEVSLDCTVQQLLLNNYTGWVVVGHTFNPSTQEEWRQNSLISRPAWAELVPEQVGMLQKKPTSKYHHHHNNNNNNIISQAYINYKILAYISGLLLNILNF